MLLFVHTPPHIFISSQYPWNHLPTHVQEAFKHDASFNVQLRIYGILLGGLLHEIEVADQNTSKLASIFVASNRGVLHTKIQQSRPVNVIKKHTTCSLFLSLMPTSIQINAGIHTHQSQKQFFILRQTMSLLKDPMEIFKTISNHNLVVINLIFWEIKFMNKIWK